MPSDRPLDRYEIALVAEPFAEAFEPIRSSWYAQQQCGRLQLRDRPAPLWLKSPTQGEVLESPFSVEGQAYEDGYVQIRTAPKLTRNLYYLAETLPVRSGEDFCVEVTEGAYEAFELYALFAARLEDLPRGNPIRALPYETGRVEIIGPIDFLVKQLMGPVRTAAELEAEAKLRRLVDARLTAPPQDAPVPPEVAWKSDVSGRVSAEAVERDLRFVLGVRHKHYVWFQSDPWQPGPDGRFEQKPVRFGVENEVEPEVRFELWLIALTPGAEEIRKGQAWLAAGLPKGAVRVAAVEVVKRRAD